MPKRKRPTEATPTTRSPVVTAPVEPTLKRTDKDTKYAPKQKSPEQLQHWKQYIKDINSAPTGEAMLGATLRYEEVDRAQGSFAFNRAKKILVRVNALSDKKWEGKSYKSFGSLKAEFFTVISALNARYLPLLKLALVTPTTSKGKRSILYGDTSTDSSTEAVPIVDNAQRSGVAVENIETVGVRSGEEGELGLPDGVEQEILRKIRCDRLSEAISHPSFQLLTKSQQQAVMNKWVSLLRN